MCILGSVSTIYIYVYVKGFIKSSDHYNFNSSVYFDKIGVSINSFLSEKVKFAIF